MMLGQKRKIFSGGVESESSGALWAEPLPFMAPRRPSSSDDVASCVFADFFRVCRAAMVFAAESLARSRMYWDEVAVEVRA